LKNKDGISTGGDCWDAVCGGRRRDSPYQGHPGHRGERPHIWQAKRNLADVIHTEHIGIYLRRWKTTWYVFELQQEQLRWCRAFTSQAEAEQFRKQQIEDTDF